MSNSLRPHGLQHARSPCPSPAPGAYSNSRQAGDTSLLPSQTLFTKTQRFQTIFIIFLCVFWLRFTIVPLLFGFPKPVWYSRSQRPSPMFPQLSRTMNPCAYINLQLSYKREMCIAKSILKFIAVCFPASTHWIYPRAEINLNVIFLRIICTSPKQPTSFNSKLTAV